MKIEIPYETAINKHSAVVAEIVAKIRSGKSKSKKIPPQEMKWGYLIYECIKSCTFSEVMNGTAARQQAEFAALSIESQLCQKLENVSVFLVGKAGKTSSSQQIFVMPDIVVQTYRKNLEKRKSEAVRIASMSEKDRNAEIEELLKKLRGPGFIEMKYANNSNNP